MKRIRNYETKRIEYRSFLFVGPVDMNAGYAIPSHHFWDMWNSNKQEAIRRAGFLPAPRKMEDFKVECSYCKFSKRMDIEPLDALDCSLCNTPFSMVCVQDWIVLLPKLGKTSYAMPAGLLK